MTWDTLAHIATIAIDLIVLMVVLTVLVGVVIYFIDKNQTTSALRRTFPLFARGRYVMEEMGIFMRQYMFAADTEELPFNRNQRSWVYRAAKNVQRVIPFGSTSKLGVDGVIFKPSMFPTQSEDSVAPKPKVIGDNCRTPFVAASLFNISGMSYGAVSKEAVTALAKGADLAGCWMNTGEGGLTPYHLENCSNIVVQIGTAKYGVRNEDGSMNWGKLREVAEHENVRMFELKVSQGAKAGKGGMLMGAKVGAEIAALRGIKIGEDSISPNRHNECSDVESLLDFVAEMRKVTGKPCGIKMALGDEEELDTLFKAASAKVDGGLDFVTIDGGEGGTGAAPASLMDYVGLPLMSALPIVARLKKKHKLDHMEIIASGKLVTPDKVCEAMALGADYCVSARGFMFALGCIQAMQCEKNTCPTGITTHNPKLTKGLDVGDKSERVASYVKNVEYEVGVIAHSCGLESPRDFAPKHLFALGGE